jgi:hypothetical protein
MIKWYCNQQWEEVFLCIYLKITKSQYYLSSYCKSW